MAKVARTDPGTTINYGEHVFAFGDDGTRQVTEAEAEVLARYTAEGGPAKVEISDEKPKSRKE